MKVALEKPFYKRIFGQDIPGSEMFIPEIKVNVGEYIIANKEILNLRPQIHGGGNVKFALPFNCRVNEIIISSTVKLGDYIVDVSQMESEDNFFENLLQQNLPKLLKSETVFGIDDFTDEYSIRIKNISNSSENYLKLYSELSDSNSDYLGLSLLNYNGNLYIQFVSTSGTFSLAKGDEVILLFENKEKIILTFGIAGNGQKFNYSNISSISMENLKTLLNEKFSKLKITSTRKKVFDIYTFGFYAENNQYESQLEGTLLLQQITKIFIKCHLDNNKNYG